MKKGLKKSPLFRYSLLDIHLEAMDSSSSSDQSYQ